MVHASAVIVLAMVCSK